MAQGLLPIVVNLGAMKRSDVPGEAFRHLREIPPEEPTNEERKQHLCIQPAVPSDLKSPPETITVPSDLKSLPETITITKEDKDSQELEVDFVEYHNERENSNEEEEDLVESHNEREDINEESRRATNQESLFTFAPSTTFSKVDSMDLC
jgi:hypothetical protein